MKNLFLRIVLCLLLPMPLVAQTLSGYIYDKETKTPISNANVFLERTSYYTVTNSKGFFKLEVSKLIDTKLVVSHLVYERIVFEDPFRNLPRDIYMDIRVNTIEEITVTGKSKKRMYSWNRQMAAFRKNFLGKTDSGKSCRILNEKDIELNYDSDTKILSAKSNKPILVENRYLGYKLQIELADFQIQYMDNSLNDAAIMYLNYQAMPLFIDLSPDNRAVNMRRAEVYDYSIQNFLKNLIDNTLGTSKYLLKKNELNQEPDSCFIVSDTMSVKRVKLKPLLQSYKGRSKFGRSVVGHVLVKYDYTYDSELVFFSDEFYVDKDGRMLPGEDKLYDVLFIGFMGRLRVGDWLPLDYEL